jgi:hypothetical protein
VVGQRPLTRRGYLTAADQPHIGHGLVGGATGRVVTAAVRRPVRPATRGRRVVSRAPAGVISGRIVVRGRASLDVPAPGGPRSRTLGSECRHRVQLRFSIAARTRAVIQALTAGPGGVAKPSLEPPHGTLAASGVAAGPVART